MIVVFRHIGILMSAGLISFVLAVNGQTGPMVVSLIAGVAWLLSRTLLPKNPYRLGSVCFFALNVAAGLGFLGGSEAAGFFTGELQTSFSVSTALRRVALAASVILSLAGWDLDRILLLLEGTTQTEGKLLLVQRHLQRLASILFAGAGLVAVTVLINLKMNFWVILILALLTFTGTGALIRGLRREPEMMPAGKEEDEK